MRTIKFRAWDTVRNEYLSAGKVFIPIYPSKAPKTCGELNLDTSNFLCAEGRMVLEQFAGLQDKNGVDIYEGDIVDDQFDCGQLSIVSYDDSKACFILTEIRKEPIYSNSMKFIRPLSICPDSSTKGKVIGNIHQSPELLEQ